MFSKNQSVYGFCPDLQQQEGEGEEEEEKGGRRLLLSNRIFRQAFVSMYSLRFRKRYHRYHYTKLIHTITVT